MKAWRFLLSLATVLGFPYAAIADSRQLLNDNVSTVTNALAGSSNFTNYLLKFLNYFRWLSLGIGMGFLCLAAIHYMTDDTTQRNEGRFAKIGLGLFIVSAGVSIMNYMISVFVE